VTVAVAGTVVLTTTVASLPTLANVVFTGGTGGLTDNHIVRNVTFSYGIPTPQLPAPALATLTPGWSRPAARAW
jgi:hypothetical protein